MSLDDTPQSGQESARAYTPAQEASVRFLEFIFGEVAESYLEFNYFCSGHKPRRLDPPSFIELPPDRDAIVTAALASIKQKSVMFGPAPRYRIPDRGKPGKDQDIAQVGCVWINLDYRSVAGGAIELLRRIHDFPLRPSVAVNSGYGHHLYFVFSSSLRAGQLTIWADLMRGLRARLDVSDRLNLSQLMRLPGTLNYKEKHPTPCEIWEEHSSWSRYGIEDLREAIEKCSGVTRMMRHSSAQTAGESLPDESDLSPNNLSRRGVDAAMLEMIVTGKAGNGGDKLFSDQGRGDGVDFSVAFALSERGFEEEEIKAIFRANPAGCGRIWVSRRDGEKYLDALLGKVKERRIDLKRIYASGNGQSSMTEEIPGHGLPPYYTLAHDGSVWFSPPVTDTDKKPARPVSVSNSVIRISEIRENIDTGQISLKLTFDYLGKVRSTLVSRSQASSARQLVAALAGEGAPITSNNARHILSYLMAYEHAFASEIPRKCVTSRFGAGRSEGAFFLPGLSSSVEYEPLGPGGAALYRAYASRYGSLRGWAETMRALAHESLMIPQVTVLTAFVPPLQRRLQIPNFILDLYGSTSTGKSTSLKLAASVYGRPHDPDSLVQQWMNTQAAVEQMAGMCSGLPLFLDDAQHCSAELKRSVVYMIANGRGKGRSVGSAGGVLETPTWHTVALSTSEDPLYESSPHEGVRGRILSIGGLTPPFKPGTAGLVQSLEKAVALNHGYAGSVFVSHVNSWTSSDWIKWRERYFNIRSELLRNTSSNIVGRVSGYIAAIQVAAEVACPLLGLPFQPDVVSAWLMLHINEQESDQNVVLASLRLLADYFVSNLESFGGDVGAEGKRRKPLQGVARKHRYVGFLRSTLETIFRQRKWNTTALLNKLAEAGVLFATENDRHTKKVCFEGVKHRMVCFKWSAILPDDLPITASNETEESSRLI